MIPTTNPSRMMRRVLRAVLSAAERLISTPSPSATAMIWGYAPAVCSATVRGMDGTTGSHAVVHLDDIQAVSVAGLRWKPVRRTLGITAFGINAYAADSGEEVVEEHDETGGGAGGHEEVYVVMAGEARFTVAGEAIDAGPGTLVFIRDPTVRRKAVAVADGTTVLAVGAKPGEAFRPSPWEWTFAADGPLRSGDHARALEIMHEALDEYPDHPGTLYNLACFEAVAGVADDAVGHLRRAHELDPRVAEWAHDDADLDPIRDRPDFPL